MIKNLATGLAANRLLFGIGFLLAPQRVSRGWIGRAGGRPAVTVLARAVGARDVVLGAGGLASLADDGADPRPWFAAQAVGDTIDLLATQAARDALPKSGYRLGIAMAGASAAVAIAATVGLARDASAA